ncbi:MAG TPA: MFS transporter [Phototrophicaceae bacterium]|nr:MFS transporter [Phototrophicaceae bacterium]
MSVLMREGVGIKSLAALTSRRSLVFNSMFGIGTLLFGFWLQEVAFPLNYQLMFIAAFGLSLVSMWHVQQVRTTSSEVRVAAGQPKVRPWKVPAFQRVAFVLITTHVTFFMLAAIIPLRLVDELDAGEEFMSYFGVAELAAAAAMAFMARRLLHKLGNLHTMSLAMLGTALSALILCQTSNLTVTLVASALSGGSWVLVSLAAFNFFSEHTPPESLTSYSTLFNQIVSLSIFVGPMIGSQLDGVGLELTTILLIGALLRMIAAGLTLINPFDRIRRPASAV